MASDPQALAAAAALRDRLVTLVEELRRVAEAQRTLADTLTRVERRLSRVERDVYAPSENAQKRVQNHGRANVPAAR